MNLLIFLIIGILIGVGGAYVYYKSRMNGGGSTEMRSPSFDGAQDMLAQCKRELERTRRELETEEEMAADIGEFTERLEGKKAERKEKAIAFLREHGEAGNDEIADRLDISSRTVVRYMDELETEGRVEQVGTTGRSVVYKAAL